MKAAPKMKTIEYVQNNKFQTSASGMTRSHSQGLSMRQHRFDFYSVGGSERYTKYYGAL